jgi:hypothetical protein
MMASAGATIGQLLPRDNAGLDWSIRMKKGSITSFRLNPKKPPVTEWRAFDAMSDEERHQAALSDSDCPPATSAQLARARRLPTIRARRALDQ